MDDDCAVGSVSVERYLAAENDMSAYTELGQRPAPLTRCPRRALFSLGSLASDTNVTVACKPSISCDSILWRLVVEKAGRTGASVSALGETESCPFLTAQFPSYWIQ